MRGWGGRDVKIFGSGSKLMITDVVDGVDSETCVAQPDHQLH